MKSLVENNKIDNHVNISKKNKDELKNIMGEIYALGYKMGKERSKFNSDETYKIF